MQEFQHFNHSVTSLSAHNRPKLPIMELHNFRLKGIIGRSDFWILSNNVQLIQFQRLKENNSETISRKQLTETLTGLRGKLFNFRTANIAF